MNNPVYGFVGFVMCGCVYVWVCVCLGFVIFGCVYVWVLCYVLFLVMCTCIYSALYCLFCVFLYCFVYVYVLLLLCSVLHRVATQLQLVIRIKVSLLVECTLPILVPQQNLHWNVRS
jgi:hypothetical protein